MNDSHFFISFSSEAALCSSDEKKKEAARKQEEAREKLKRLEELILKIAGKIESEQPEKANKLRDAWKSLREKLILEDMELVGKALLDGALGSGFMRVRGILEKLVKVLDELTDTYRRKDRKSEKEALEDAIRRIDKIKPGLSDRLDC